MIEEDNRFLEGFLKLKEFRVVKYRKVIQNILFLLGYKKSDINIPGKDLMI